MGQAIQRIQKRNKARLKLAEIISRPENVYVIHYSCESFDRPDGSSPRITSIAVRNLESAQTTSFSIHQMAEREHIDNADIANRYDQLEKMMLDEFYNYMQRHSNATWVHWNMRNMKFGFQALAHRYRVLGGSPIDVHEKQLIDLARMLVDLYGSNYIEHKRLPNLLKKNGMEYSDFLIGEAESEAFKNKDFFKLHESTLRKVDVFCHIADMAYNNTLLTNATHRDRYGSYPEAISEYIQENWWIKWAIGIVTFVSAIVGILSFFLS